MGNTPSNPLNLSKCTVIKNNNDNLHLIDQLNKQEYLSVKFCLRNNNEFLNHSTIENTLEKRKKIYSTCVPFLKTIQKEQFSLCGSSHQYNLIFSHPYKSLASQIEHRKEVGECFSEGQIWMIGYSCLQALSLYEKLNINVNCYDSTIFISKEGQVLLSDGDFWVRLEDEWKIQKYEKIYQVGKILNELIYLFEEDRQYSLEVRELAKTLENREIRSLKKSIQFLTNLRKKYQKKQPFNEVINVSQFQQISSILEENKTSIINLSQYMSVPVEKQNINTQTLSQKNKQFLQSLLHKQKNIILEVPQSQYDTSSFSTQNWKLSKLFQE